MKKALILLLIALWAPAACFGGTSFIDGNRLHESCRDGSPEKVDSFCYGYIASAVDTYETWRQWDDLKPEFCVPNHVTIEQATLVTIKYMNEHPEELHLIAGAMVIKALKIAFPCP